MKALTRAFFIISFMFAAHVASAQTFRFKVGLNLSKMEIKNQYIDLQEERKIKTGFLVGITSDIPLSNLLSLETGFLISNKGTRLRLEDTINDEHYLVKYNTNLFYIDIPLTAKFNFPMGDINIYGLAGPNLGFGIFGKIKEDVRLPWLSDYSEYKVEWGKDQYEHQYRRFDLGLIIGGGIEIGKTQIGVSYNHGLTNIRADRSNGLSHKNRVLCISLAFKFNG